MVTMQLVRFSTAIKLVSGMPMVDHVEYCHILRDGINPRYNGRLPLHDMYLRLQCG